MATGLPEYRLWTSSWWATKAAPLRPEKQQRHNVFYCLPLILGLIGLFWQAYKTKRITTPNGEEIEEPIGIQQFWIVFFLFFMTGLAIVLYLNQTPDAAPRT